VVGGTCSTGALSPDPAWSTPPPPIDPGAPAFSLLGGGGGVDQAGSGGKAPVEQVPPTTLP